MRNVIKKLLIIFGVFTLMMLGDRLAFTAVYGHGIAGSVADVWLRPMLHGLPIDLCVAAYLSVVPFLLVIADIWLNVSWLRRVERAYYYVAAVLLAAIFTADLVLYGYWDFRLDMTPLFYFLTSPSAAMASAPWWAPAAGIAVVAVLGWLMARALILTAGRVAITVTGRRRAGATAVAAVLTAALFLPIRGGITVSTMNLSRAYFSSDMNLNHLAINPAFSLLYSATHHDDFDSQFRFFDSDDAARAALPAADTRAVADTVALDTARPDIYLVILESFSAHLMPSLGGEPIAVKLDSIAADGVLWTRFYANSFRTDRALPAILGGFPSQPTTSVMKFVDKAERLPGLAAELSRQAGYATAYYYGGDANFTNMQAYVRGSGFGRLVSDADFPLSQRLSKWGAHDHVVFARALADSREAKGGPRFTVVQTSSSHEPFEVPYASRRFADNERANAFAYADSCLAVFVDAVNRLPRKSLIVIVPDHYAVWPLRATLTEPAQRHHVPLVMTGSALATRGRRLDTVGSQNDLAATLLGMLGLDASAFPFSHNLLDASQPHFAWIAEPELAGVITADGAEGYISTADGSGLPRGQRANAEAARAWLQLIYSELAK